MDCVGLWLVNRLGCLEFLNWIFLRYAVRACVLEQISIWFFLQVFGVSVLIDKLLLMNFLASFGVRFAGCIYSEQMTLGFVRNEQKIL